jgi:spore coat polysaccharide biosynthesis protein SpsF
MDLGGKPALFHVVERSLAAKSLDEVIVATSTLAADDAIEALCRAQGYKVFRGSEDDVLARYYHAALPYDPDVVVRITADCPLVVPEGADEVVKTLVEKDLDYCFWDLTRIPLGLGSEAVRFPALAEAFREARLPPEREHVTMFVHDRPKRYRVQICQTTRVPNRTDLRLTVDTPEDYAVLKAIYAELYSPGKLVSIWDVERFCDLHPEIARLNAHIEQKKV